MAYQLNRKLAGLTPYQVDAGRYEIRLDANESFLTPPPALREQILRAAGEVAFNRYPNPEAARLCDAFAGYYKIRPELVTAANGSDELLFLLCTTFLCRGQKILLAAPDFSMYRVYAELAECEVCVYDKGDDLAIDPDAFLARANEVGADMVLFSNPCNPTSLGLDRDAVRRIVRGVRALVVLDEAYMDFWDQSLIREAERYDNLILLRTCSKMVGFAALRVGFAVANPTLTRALHAAKSPYNVGSLPQAAAELVLREHEYLDRCRETVIASRAALQQSLAPLAAAHGARLFESRTNFVFLRIAGAQTIFARLKERGILVRCFGDCLRITAGSAEENARLLDTLAQILDEPAAN